MTDMLHGLAWVALAVLTLGFAAFCFLFHVLADWRATVMGRHVMAFMGTITVVLLYSLADFTFDLPTALGAAFQFVFFSSLAAVVWKRIALLIKIQKQARAQEVHKFWRPEDGD